MPGRVIDFRDPERAKRSPLPTIPPWDVDAVLMLNTDRPHVPLTAEVRWRIILNADNSFTVKLQREGETYSLILTGDDETHAVSMLRELLAASFGVAA